MNDRSSWRLNRDVASQSRRWLVCVHSDGTISGNHDVSLTVQSDRSTTLDS